MRNSRVWIALAILASIVAAPTTAAAQAQRTGPTFRIGVPGHTVRYPDVAYDPRNDRYLAVTGNGFVSGYLMNGAGGVLVGFPISTTGVSQNPRIAYGADVNNGAGGYLVTWHESLGNFAVVFGRLISADGGLIGAPFQISVEPGASTNWEMGAAVAYATGSREFLVAWQGMFASAWNIHYTRINYLGQMLQAPIAITAGTDYELDPSVAYSPHDDEFYIAYAGYSDRTASGYVAGQRIKAGSGVALPSASAVLFHGVVSQVPAVAYNASTRQYLVTWYHRSAGAAMYGITVTASTGGVASGVRLMSGYYFAYDANDVDYNPASNDFLLVTHGQNWEDAAVLIKGDGVPYDNGFVLTNTTDVRPILAGDGNFNPRVVASQSTGRYLAVTSAKFAAVHGQFATSAGGVTPPPPVTSDPKIYVDYPANGSSVSTQFAVVGWALDLGSATGTGVSAVHVWAFPTAGGNPIFVGAAALNGSRPDIAAHFGNQRFSTAGFSLQGTLPPGTYDLRVSGLSTVAGGFNMAAVSRITVTAPASIPMMYVDNPAQNQNVSQSFSVSGWAVDAGAPFGTGVDGIHVWAYPVAGGNPIWVGEGILGQNRMDVANYFGRPGFATSGYFLQGSLPRGQYYLVVFAHSTVAQSFNQAALVVINVL